MAWYDPTSWDWEKIGKTAAGIATGAATGSPILTALGGAFGEEGVDAVTAAFTPPKIGTTPVLGVGNVGTKPEEVEDEYQRRLRAEMEMRQRADEIAAFEAQRARITGAMQPSTVATQAARQQAMTAGAATMGAARSLAGTAGVQTGALGALGAGQAQQAGMSEARQVQAAEEQRNAVAQMQLAQILREQELGRYGLERGDVAQALGAQRALLAPELEMGQEYASREAQRSQRMKGAITQAVATGGAELYGAYQQSQRAKAKSQEDELRRKGFELEF